MATKTAIITESQIKTAIKNAIASDWSKVHLGDSDSLDSRGNKLYPHILDH